jgi:hypothetical protein
MCQRTARAAQLVGAPESHFCVQLRQSISCTVKCVKVLVDIACEYDVASTLPIRPVQHAQRGAIEVLRLVHQNEVVVI